MKPQTMTIAQQPQSIAAAYCDICKCDKPIFHDRSGAAFFTRHQQSGNWRPCGNSGKKVAKR